jgi:hypothetical protein
MPVATRKQERSPFAALEAITQAPPPELTSERRGPGRPRGKRSDDTYRTWSGFLPKEAVLRASMRLMETHDKRDMSDLLGELLTTWVEQQAKVNS